MKRLISSLFLLAVIIHSVQCDAAEKSSSPGASFSLEELMLLADAAEKAHKNANKDEEPQSNSNFQHRLKQLIQTARTAAGSGQSTGNDILDQTIRQVRARLNANGGAASISDTSIFDAALKAFGSGGTSPAPASIVDTVIKQLKPEAAPTTPPPQQDSFLSGLLKQLANGNQGGGTDAKSALLDVVVKQFVSTTTTTTTTTTTPRPLALQLLDGLINQARNSGAHNESVDGSKQPTQKNVLGEFQQFFQQLLKKPQQPPTTQPGAPTDGKEPRAGGDSQLLAGFLNQIQKLQAGGQGGNSSDGGSSTGGLGDVLKQIQGVIRTRFGAPSVQPTPSTGAAGEAGLEGFDGLIRVDEPLKQPEKAALAEVTKNPSKKAPASLDT